MTLAQKIETLLEIIQKDKDMLRDIAKEYNTAYTLEVEGIPASFGKMKVSENGIKFDNTFEVLFEDLEDVFGENIDLTKINRYGISASGTIVGVKDSEIKNFYSIHFELIHFADKNICDNVLQSLKGNSIDEKKFAASITTSLNKVVDKLSSRGDGEGGDDGNVDNGAELEFTFSKSHHDNKDNHKEQNLSLPRRNFGGEIDRFMRELPEIKEPEKDDDLDFDL